MSVTIIETTAAFDELVSHLLQQTLIAVDTEFQRETTYYPELALVQIACEDTVVCIDPLAFNARPGLASLMLNADLTKLFHSCSQDLEVLHYYLGDCPVNIEDSQIAYALLSDQLQVSYAAMINTLMAKELDKSQTRTDWLKRPLTDKQLKYAAEDVLYLYQCYPILMQQLMDAGRKPWYIEECAKLSSCVDIENTQFPELWKRVKGTTKLDRKQLAIIQAIAVWRESLAQQKNRPRRRILPDDVVIKISDEQPITLGHLSAVLKQHARGIDQHALSELLASIDRAISLPEAQWPDNRFTVLNNQQKQLLKKLQQSVNTVSDQLGISPSVLYSRKQLEQLILNRDATKVLNINEWRYHIAGKQLHQIIENNSCNG